MYNYIPVHTYNVYCNACMYLDLLMCVCQFCVYTHIVSVTYYALYVPVPVIDIHLTQDPESHCVEGKVTICYIYNGTDLEEVIPSNGSCTYPKRQNTVVARNSVGNSSHGICAISKPLEYFISVQVIKVHV